MSPVPAEAEKNISNATVKCREYKNQFFIMVFSETKIRVRYGETDQMGYCYYGNYAQYYEVGRADAMRSLGMSYREMEDRGVFMPIVSMSCRYFRPAHYDDLLTVKTIVKNIPAARMHFYYEIVNQEGLLINSGETILAFISKKTNRPCPAPDWFLEPLKKRLEENHEA